LLPGRKKLSQSQKAPATLETSVPLTCRAAPRYSARSASGFPAQRLAWSCQVCVIGVSFLKTGSGPDTNSVPVFTGRVNPLTASSSPSAARGLCRQYPLDALPSYPSSTRCIGLEQLCAPMRNIFGLIPLGLGLIAERFDLMVAMWLLLLGPIALLVGIRHSLGLDKRAQLAYH